MINLPIKSRIKSHEARPEKEKSPSSTDDASISDRQILLYHESRQSSFNRFSLQSPQSGERKKKTVIAAHSIFIIMPNPFLLAGPFSDSKTRRGETSEESQCASRIQIAAATGEGFS